MIYVFLAFLDSRADFVQLAASPLMLVLGTILLARWVAYSRVLLLNVLGRFGLL